MPFLKAVKEQGRLRLAITGPSGSGKTYSALAVGCRLAERCGGRVALIDSERHSAAKYADIFDFDTDPDALHDVQSPEEYTKLIEEAETAGYPVIVIDSLSHAWMGKNGALELVDKVSKRSRSGNSFAAWREITPRHNRLIDTILRSTAHIIVTMRSKTEWVMEKDEKTGKTVPRKIGTAPVMRAGIEYEFDIGGEMDLDHQFMISKTRMASLDEAVISKPGTKLADQLYEWLTSGKAAAPVKKKTPPPPESDGDKSETEKSPDPVPDKPNPAPSKTVDKTAIQKCLAEYMKVAGEKDIRVVREKFIQVPCGVVALQDVDPKDYMKILRALWKEYGTTKTKIPDELTAVLESVKQK